MHGHHHHRQRQAEQHHQHQTPAHASRRLPSQVCDRSVRNALSNALASMRSLVCSSIATANPGGGCAIRKRWPASSMTSPTSASPIRALLAVDPHDARRAGSPTPAARAKLVNHGVLARDPAAQQLNVLIRRAADRQLVARRFRCRNTRRCRPGLREVRVIVRPWGCRPLPVEEGDDDVQRPAPPAARW